MLTLVIILSAVTYRVTRFILADTLIAQPRNWFKSHLLGIPTSDEDVMDQCYRAQRRGQMDRVGEWRLKLYELFDCHFCASGWVAGGAVLITRRYADIALPVWVWLAVMAGAVVIWEYVED